MLVYSIGLGLVVICLARYIRFFFHSSGINNMPLLLVPDFLCFWLLPYLFIAIVPFLLMLCIAFSIISFFTFVCPFILLRIAILEPRVFPDQSLYLHAVGVSNAHTLPSSGPTSWILLVFFVVVGSSKTNTFCSRCTPRFTLAFLKHCLEVLCLSPPQLMHFI